MSTKSASTISARLVWPFLRVCGTDPRALAVFAEGGLNLTELVQPDARIPHALVMRLLDRLVDALENPLLGLKAGAAVARGDLEVLEQAANSHATLRGAAELIARYLGVVHGGATFSLVEDNNVAMWRYVVVDGVAEPTAAHDFVVSSLCNYVRLYTERDEPKLAVHFSHGDRTNLDEYRRLFRCPIRFDMECTGVVFPASRLSWTFSQPTLALSAAFEARAREKLAELTSEQPLSELVRQTIRANIQSGDVTMASLARRLGMSEATLRRKLAAEGTTHSDILDEARKELALSLLARSDIHVSEVAYLLGFSDAAVFHRAFKRWTGTTPAAYRRREE